MKLKKINNTKRIVLEPGEVGWSPSPDKHGIILFFHDEADRAVANRQVGGKKGQCGDTPTLLATAPNLFKRLARIESVRS